MSVVSNKVLDGILSRERKPSRQDQMVRMSPEDKQWIASFTKDYGYNLSDVVAAGLALLRREVEAKKQRKTRSPQA